jgi:hypothetical protein
VSGNHRDRTWRHPALIGDIARRCIDHQYQRQSAQSYLDGEPQTCSRPLIPQLHGGEFPFRYYRRNAARLSGHSKQQRRGRYHAVVDAKNFVPSPAIVRFDVSDQATLHMEDTTPLQIATGAQGSGVLATPTRSLYQTDSLAIRMLVDLNWGLRRAGVIVWTQTMTWN